MTKIIEIDGKQHTITSNALLPKKYRHQFNRDLIADMKALTDSYSKTGDFDETVLARLTWLMLRESGEDVGETPDEWLGSLETVFGLYEILPDVVELWVRGTHTTSKPKKK